MGRVPGTPGSGSGTRYSIYGSGNTIFNFRGLPDRHSQFRTSSARGVPSTLIEATAARISAIARTGQVSLRNRARQRCTVARPTSRLYRSPLTRWSVIPSCYTRSCAPRKKVTKIASILEAPTRARLKIWRSKGGTDRHCNAVRIRIGGSCAAP
jgi:hypothetical protein